MVMRHICYIVIFLSYCHICEVTFHTLIVHLLSYEDVHTFLGV